MLVGPCPSLAPEPFIYSTTNSRGSPGLCLEPDLLARQATSQPQQGRTGISEALFTLEGRLLCTLLKKVVLAVKKQSSSSSSRLQYPLLILRSTVTYLPRAGQLPGASIYLQGRRREVTPRPGCAANWGPARSCWVTGLCPLPRGLSLQGARRSGAQETLLLQHGGDLGTHLAPHCQLRRHQRWPQVGACGGCAAEHTPPPARSLPRGPDQPLPPPGSSAPLLRPSHCWPSGLRGAPRPFLKVRFGFWSGPVWTREETPPALSSTGGSGALEHVR